MHPELRLHPRMPVDLPAELVFSEEDSVDLTVLNISLGGVTAQGDAGAYQMVEKYKPHFPIEVELHFGLVDQPVHCHCRLIHSQRLSQDLYRFGFKVLSLDLQTQHLIQTTLEAYERSQCEG